MQARWLNKLAPLLVCLLLTTAQAQESIGPGGGFNADATNQSSTDAVALTRGTCVTDTANGTTYNSAGFQATGVGGTETDTGYIVIGVAAEDATATFGISSMTINGLAATEITDENGTGIVDTAIYISTIPYHGTTVNVSVTATESVTSMVVCGWKLKNLQSTTAQSSVSDPDAASGALVLTTGTTSTAGFVVGICTNSGVADAATWAVLTEREDAQHGEADYSNADAAGTGASMSNTCDWTGTNAAAGSAAAFR